MLALEQYHIKKNAQFDLDMYLVFINLANKVFIIMIPVILKRVCLLKSYWALTVG